jgi:hypothetical protein
LGDGLEPFTKTRTLEKRKGAAPNLFSTFSQPFLNLFSTLSNLLLFLPSQILLLPYKTIHRMQG